MSGPIDTARLRKKLKDAHDPSSGTRIQSRDDLIFELPGVLDELERKTQDDLQGCVAIARQQERIAQLEAECSALGNEIAVYDEKWHKIRKYADKLEAKIDKNNK